MLFDDAFYPGNPGRRQEVANIRGEIVNAFDLFNTEINFENGEEK